MIAGNDSADVVSGSASAGGLFDASCRSNNELIGGEHKFRSYSFLRRWRGGQHQSSPAQVFSVQGIGRRKRLHRDPVFSRSDQGCIAPSRQFGGEVSWTPQETLRVVAASGLDAVEDV